MTTNLTANGAPVNIVNMGAGRYRVTRRGESFASLPVTLGHVERYRERTGVMTCDRGLNYCIGCTEATRWLAIAADGVRVVRGFRTRADAVEFVVGR